MVIHLYTFVYNEEKILPHFFKHYEDFVDKFFIYDNQSTDNTKNIVLSRDDTEYLQFDTNDQFDEFEITKLRNSEWVKSSRSADWVIVCDADEFFYFKISNLEKITEDNYTVVKPLGYNMITNKFPKSTNKKLVDKVKRGHRVFSLDKPILFKPDIVMKTNLSLGSHFAMPEGYIKVFNSEEFLLLHYKNLGLEYSLEKKNLANSRVPITHVEKGVNRHYTIDDKKYKKSFKKQLKKAKKVI